MVGCRRHVGDIIMSQTYGWNYPSFGVKMAFDLRNDDKSVLCSTCHDDRETVELQIV